MKQISLFCSAVFLIYGVGLLSAKSDHHAPVQVHIAFGENEREIVVTWTTKHETPGATVQYGREELELTAVGTSRTFVDGGRKQRNIHMHRASLSELEPNSTYSYRCGSSKGWSETFWFRTTPAGTNWSPKLTIIGDMGLENAVSMPRLQEETDRRTIDAVIHVGDFAYDLHNKNGKLGDKFMAMIEPVAAHVPYMVCPGNHEQNYNYSHYRERFTMPGKSENLYYSFNLGPVHFVSINTEAYFYLEYGMHLVVDQYNWLVNDLEEANKNREERPWIVLYGHRPMYCSGIYHECKDTPIRKGLNGSLNGLEELLSKYGVDLTFWGHQHDYERHWPVFDDTVRNGSSSQPYVNHKAPIHIITGSAGCKEEIEPFAEEAAPSSAVRLPKYGITELQFFNATHMSLRMIRTDDGNKVADEILVVQEHHGPYGSS